MHIGISGCLNPFTGLALCTGLGAVLVTRCSAPNPFLLASDSRGVFVFWWLPCADMWRVSVFSGSYHQTWAFETPDCLFLDVSALFVPDFPPRGFCHALGAFQICLSGLEIQPVHLFCTSVQ